eukprot:6011809-Alexandrium_andersonii.AAC.1
MGPPVNHAARTWSSANAQLPESCIALSGKLRRKGVRSSPRPGVRQQAPFRIQSRALRWVGLWPPA